MSFSSISSTLERFCRSVLFVPSSKEEVKPEQLVVLGLALFTSKALYKDYLKPLLKDVTTKALSSLSQLSETIGVPLVQAGVVPDSLIRMGIRLQLSAHLAELESVSCEMEQQSKMATVEKLKSMPIAVETDAANTQHYEVPSKFYDLCLVRRLLPSLCFIVAEFTAALPPSLLILLLLLLILF